LCLSPRKKEKLLLVFLLLLLSYDHLGDTGKETLSVLCGCPTQ